MEFLLLITGFIMLIKGANYFVDGASSIAKFFKVPTIIIGLTIVAFGTSSPELAVNINAILKNSNNIALGNIVGSNILNILLILGITSIIKPMHINKNTLTKEFPFLILSTLVLFVLSLDIYSKNGIKQLSKIDGFVLLILFIAFFYYLINSTVKSKITIENTSNTEEAENITKYYIYKSIGITVCGLAAIIIGGNLVVEQSVIIAKNFGISERIIGLTIVAIGTSLPELVTSVVAAYKNEADIAIGNIVGSNIFNMLFILGISSWIRPLPIDSSSYFDILFLVFATIITYILCLSKKNISRYEGITLSFFYIAYMSYILI